MRRNLRSFAAHSLLISLLCYSPVLAAPQRDDAKAEKVKTAIAKLGTGFAARVDLRLKDKTKHKGYVREATEEYFVVVDDDTGAPTQVAYSQIKQIKGKNKLNWDKIIAGVFVGALILYGLTFDGNF